MIILGERYTFSHLETERLDKKFHHIDIVLYRSRDTDTVIQEIEQMIQGSEKKIIVLNTLAVLPAALLSFLTQLEERHGIHYLTIETFLERYLDKLYVSPSLQHTQNEGHFYPYSPWQYIQKRFIDICSIIALLLPSIFLSLYAIYRIKKESDGPIFFKQKRIGLYEKEFTCIKFRSMHIDAEKDGAKFADQDDNRAFKWGKKMRSSKLDELPQLWNVLKGEMHLIGPRPERSIWTREFEKGIPDYHKRHLVAPGITGWAQMRYHYGKGKIDARQKLMYDLYYIKNWNFLFDVKIIWKTALFLFANKTGKFLGITSEDIRS